MEIVAWPFVWRKPVDLEKRIGNIVSAGIVALLCWVAFTVHQDSKDLAVMKAELHRLRMDFDNYRKMNGSEVDEERDDWHANKSR